MCLTQECLSNSKSSDYGTKPLTQPVLLTCLEHQAPSTSPAPRVLQLPTPCVHVQGSLRQRGPGGDTGLNPLPPTASSFSSSRAFRAMNPAVNLHASSPLRLEKQSPEGQNPPL